LIFLLVVMSVSMISFALIYWGQTEMKKLPTATDCGKV